MSLCGNSNAGKVIKGSYDDRTKRFSKGKEDKTKQEAHKEENETQDDKEIKGTRRHKKGKGEEGKLNEIIDVVNTTKEESMTMKAEMGEMRKEITTKAEMEEVRKEVRK